MRNYLLSSVGCMLLLSSTMAAAQQRCPAKTNNCTLDNAAQNIRDRVNEGARKVMNGENPEGRVNEVRHTLQDCVECGMNAIKNGMNQITIPNNSGSSGSSDSQPRDPNSDAGTN